MDRARRAHPRGDRWEDRLKRLLVLCALVAACNELTGNFGDIVAIEYRGPLSLRIEEGDTLRLVAHALDLQGDTLFDAQIVWTVIELDTTPVGFTLDSATGLVTAVTPGGPWRVQGRVDDLRTNPPIQVSVRAAPDSIAGPDSTRLTVAVGETQSTGLVVTVFDLTTTPGEERALGDARIVFRVTDPLPASGGADAVAIIIAAEVGEDPHRVETTTNLNGQASAFARRIGTGQPDSIVVESIALTARGDTVPGSPVTFVVQFLNN